MPHSIRTIDITFHASLLPHNDADASLAFSHDTFGVDFAPRRSS